MDNYFIEGISSKNNTSNKRINNEVIKNNKNMENLVNNGNTFNNDIKMKRLLYMNNQKNDHDGVLTAVVYGSIHETAYYFTDALIGTEILQRQSIILDTGSSVFSFQCENCNECGVHLDEPFNPLLSKTTEPLACSNQCKYCDRFGKICGYKVDYLEGSSLKGLWYEDLISFVRPFNEISSNNLTNLFFKSKNNDYKNNNENEYLRNNGKNNNTTITEKHLTLLNKNFQHLSTKIKVESSFGCNLGETNLFVSQEASGILGLETWSQNGPPTFIFSAFSSYKFKKKIFSLCFSENGGIFTLGDMNTKYHLKQREVNYSKIYDANNNFNIDFIGEMSDKYNNENDYYGEFYQSNNNVNISQSTPFPRYMVWSNYNPAEQRYRVRIIDIKIGSIKINLFNSNTKFDASVENSNNFFPFNIKNDMFILFDNHAQKEETEIQTIVALVDSGTTLTYLPLHVYNQVFKAIIDTLKSNGISVSDEDSSFIYDKSKEDKKAKKNSYYNYDKNLNNLLEFKNDKKKLARVRKLNRIKNKKKNYFNLKNKNIQSSDTKSNKTFENKTNIFSLYKYLTPFNLTSLKIFKKKKEQANYVLEKKLYYYNKTHIDLDAGKKEQKNKLINNQNIEQSNKFNLHDNLLISAKLRKTQEMPDQKVEECFYLQNGNADLSMFPIIKFTFLPPTNKFQNDHSLKNSKTNNNNISVSNNMLYEISKDENTISWYPNAYMYQKHDSTHRCLAFVPDYNFSQKAVLGSSFFINHDVIFDLQNKLIGFAAADCPVNHIHERFVY